MTDAPDPGRRKTPDRRAAARRKDATAAPERRDMVVAGPARSGKSDPGPEANAAGSAAFAAQLLGQPGVKGSGPYFLLSRKNEITRFSKNDEYPQAEPDQPAEVMERYLTPGHLLGHQPPLLWVEHYERTAADRRIGLTESWEQITFAHYRRERTRKFARVPGFRYRIGLPRHRELLSPETFAALRRQYVG